ncbi:alpha-mannosidase [Paenibacillus sp. GCM10027629]|uniref:alpha-mannosidase n=1 Tax=Paenibacillus sp. GCM10027629 TaxID=3273414 RepID=UPI0036368F8A
MEQRRTAHIISHTHWDREWYLPYEKHHVRLVELVDALLDKLDQDPDFKSFCFDGQTIILEDYLQVRPGQRERLTKYIQEGRIMIGPWYILQDAFLTSGEANVRNMQVGHEDSKRFGEPAKIGYFPDTFGLVGQTPQLMQQSGITNAFFGRGVKPTGFNNTVSDGGYESSFSELMWEGPDGSKVLGILFANWYSNGNEVPTDKEEAKKFWDRKLADAEKYASTRELLFMNGCDHQPIQLDVPEAIRVAKELYPDTEFIHSNFIDYLAAVEGAMERELSSVRGELRSQRTDGWGTLVNTASARVYLKQMNQTGQMLLEKVAEPLATFADLLGRPYPHDLLTYAWKTLMQNHPHDSICGCSVDEVHREMVTRFDKSRHVAESIVDTSVRTIADAVDTTGFEAYGEEPLPLVVFNTTGWSRTGVVSVELEVAKIYEREGIRAREMTERMKAVSLAGRVLVDTEGNAIPCTVEDLGVVFGYDLPNDKFRQPFLTRKVRLTFQAEGIPALGLHTYAWVLRSEEASQLSSLVTGDRSMANHLLQVEIAEDGSYTLTDKRTGRVYTDLGIYESTGDIGNEYMYKQPEGEQALTTKGLPAQVRVLEDSAYRASFEIVHEWEIPASAEELLGTEQRELVGWSVRKAQRSNKMVPFTIRTVLTLDRNGRGVQIETSYNNQAQDHRLRALFPTDVTASTHDVDSMFEIVKRSIEPAPEWTNPSNTQHQQAFVDVSEAGAGLTVANFGLNEYEVLRDGRNTIAVTLLRSVGELGDWGYFPTPEAQCIGEHTVRMEVIPHDGDGIESGAYAEAYQFQVPWTACQTGVHAGRVSAVCTPFRWESRAAAFSSLKMSPETGDMMLRWYNMSAQPVDMVLNATIQTEQLYKTTILEQSAEPFASEATEGVTLPLGPCEIVTIGVKPVRVGVNYE